MLFSTTPKVEELIVLTLAKEPNSSAADIRELIAKRHKKISVQAVYQELKKLEKQGMVTRHKKQYSLGLSWVLELAAFADTVYDRYTEPDVLGLLPEEGEKAKAWTFRSIESFLPFWTNLLMCMVQSSEDRNCYEYMDHVWFHLSSSPTEAKLLKAMKNLGSKHYIAIGGSSRLDQRYQDEVSIEHLTLKYGQRIFPEDKENYLSCVGPYVLRIRPKKSFLAEIEDFQNAIGNSSSPNMGEISEFIKRKSSFRMTIENNPLKADKIRKAFSEFFGIVTG